MLYSADVECGLEHSRELVNVHELQAFERTNSTVALGKRILMLRRSTDFHILFSWLNTLRAFPFVVLSAGVAWHNII